MTAALLPPAEPVLIFDNMSGEQASSELANFLTAESRTDRILGMSQLETELPNRALVLMSGKNLSFSQESARRVLTWHIDHGQQGVFVNAFTSCPVEMVLDRRPEMIVAALTLIRGAHLSGRKPTQTRTPSYGQWDLLVRQTILWITEELLPGGYEDPLDLLEEASVSTGDQTDTYELLTLLHERYGDGFFKASELATAVAIGDAELRTQLDGLARGRGEPLSAKSIGRYLRGLLNQRVGDLRMRNRMRGHMCEWAVERLPAQPGHSPGGSSGSTRGAAFTAGRHPGLGIPANPEKQRRMMTMQIDHLRPKTIEGTKRLATRIKKRDGLRHCAALDLAATQAGIANYRHARASVSETHAKLPE